MAGMHVVTAKSRWGLEGWKEAKDCQPWAGCVSKAVEIRKMTAFLQSAGVVRMEPAEMALYA